jgi:multiple sugar transport system permease protein
MLMRFFIPNKRRYTPYLFLLPAALLIFIFLFLPVVNVFLYSFQNYILSKPYLKGFIGLDNYKEIFLNDKTFYTVILVSIKWVFFTVFIELIIGLVAALVLNARFWGRVFFRVLFFIPWAISGILTSLLFSLIYNEQMGFLNSLLMDMGIINKTVAWIANENVVFGSVVVAEIWRGFPFFVIILLASLQSIQVEIYDSCKVDGAGKISTFLYVILPHIKETILFSTLLRIIWEFNNVDVIYNITGGGPANMTTTLSMYIVRQASKLGNFGYGSALTVIAFSILAIFIIVYMKFGNFEEGGIG